MQSATLFKELFEMTANVSIWHGANTATDISSCSTLLRAHSTGPAAVIRHIVQVIMAAGTKTTAALWYFGPNTEVTVSSGIAARAVYTGNTQVQNPPVTVR
jgi:hypothetical protein